jgi:RNA polymerase II subunit A small phosphatase-like protein
MTTKLLILDLDETLVFATERRLALIADFQVGSYFVYQRPVLKSFIEFVFVHFKVAVWTSSGSSYAKEIVRAIFEDPEKLQFVWTRQRCTWRLDPDSREGHWIKDLRKVRRLGFSLENIVVIDDSPEKLRRQYGNTIYVTPFIGDPLDQELRKLQGYLLWLKNVPNVRLIEKRNWRTAPEIRHIH